MHPHDEPHEAAFRAEARAWLGANAPERISPSIAPSAIVAEWTPEEEAEKLAQARAWQATKFEAGWAGIAWPTAYGGRGGSLIEHLIFDQEEARFDVPRDALVVGLGWCGPALLMLATEEQKQRFLPRMLRGDEVWCQLFSEPSAGSDLAGLETRAVRDGDEWVLTGQKVWTTFAHRSDWGLCIARHDRARHAGLTAFVVDMRAHGVHTRPIRQMTGAANFNEVFLDTVRVPDRHRVGAVGDGWRVVITTFMYERAAASIPVAQILEASRRLVEASDPDRRTRDAWTELHVLERVITFTALRMMTAISRGKMPGPEGSIQKLVGTQLLTRIYDHALEVLGPEGMLFDGDAPAGGEWQDAFLGMPGIRIGGGTDEIQRNIIGERILGLPRQ